MESTKIVLKHKEVWRDSNGQFGKAPEPVVIEEKPQEDNSGAMTFYSVVGILPTGAIAFMYPAQFVGLVLLVAAGYTAYRVYKKHPEVGTPLVINRNGKSTVIYL